MVPCSVAPTGTWAIECNTWSYEEWRNILSLSQSMSKHAPKSFPTFGLPVMVAPASIMMPTVCVEILKVFLPGVWVEVFEQILHRVKCSNGLIQGFRRERRVSHWWRGIGYPLRVTYISVHLEWITAPLQTTENSYWWTRFIIERTVT